MHDRGAAVGRVASIVFLGIVPIVAVIVMFQIGWSSDSLAIDFHNEIYPEAKLILDGTNPFPGPDAALSHGRTHLAAVRRLRRGAADAAAGRRRPTSRRRCSA